MLVLTSSDSLLRRIFPNEQAQFIPKNDDFPAFPFDDLKGEPQCYRIETTTSWQYAILEEYAGSSQFDRLRTWNGASVYALALDGRGFHGQFARRWHTEPGNLFLCTAMPTQIEVRHAPKLQIIPTKAIIEALRPRWHVEMGCRFRAPNDVVILREGSYAKIAGVLTEMRLENGRIVQVRYGLGLNIDSAPVLTDPGHLPAAACGEFLDATLPKSDLKRLILNDILSFIAAHLDALKTP